MNVSKITKNIQQDSHKYQSVTYSCQLIQILSFYRVWGGNVLFCAHYIIFEIKNEERTNLCTELLRWFAELNLRFHTTCPNSTFHINIILVPVSSSSNKDLMSALLILIFYFFGLLFGNRNVHRNVRVIFSFICICMYKHTFELGFSFGYRNSGTWHMAQRSTYLIFYHALQFYHCWRPETPVEAPIKFI